MEPHHETSTIFSDLPLHIAVEILSRLSTKTVSRCRCVCKQWQALALSPEFSNSLRSKTRPALMLFTTNSHPSQLTTLELEDEPTRHDMYYRNGSPITDLTDGLTPNCTSLFGSLNGLLCFHEFGLHNPDRILVLNPATTESITLPNPSPGGLVEYPSVTSYGFGETSVSSELKVVRIFQAKLTTNKSECHVYTLGKGCWRLLHEPAPFVYGTYNGVFFNGCIHWLVLDELNDKLMVSYFDLEKETFGFFPALPNSDCYPAALGVYKGGFLSICDNTSEFEIEVWVMEEYGVKESWAKKTVIDKRPWDKDGEFNDFVRLLRVFEDGVILLLWGEYRKHRIYSYNPETSYLQEIDVQNLACLPDKFQEYMDVVDYEPSFLSLTRFERERVQFGPLY